jgi:hypothetical protein
MLKEEEKEEGGISLPLLLHPFIDTIARLSYTRISVENWSGEIWRIKGRF